MSDYGAILIDPPWSNKDFGAGLEAFQNWPYPVMRLRDIVKVPVNRLGSENSHLWMWTVNATLPHACWLQQQWGYTHMNVITWVKPNGWGYWWANATEHLLFGYRGTLKMKSKLKPTVIFADRRKHSQKPERSYELIEEVSFGPYLELFARNHRPGWDVWGNEVEGIDLEGGEVVSEGR